MKWLICLAGGIASGKTTLAEALQAALPDSARLAFGDVVRSRARAVHSKPTREQLQEAGLQLIREGWLVFVDELLSGLEGDPSVLIVEGIRHREAVDTLQKRLPERRLFVVYVEVSADERRERLAQRSETEQALAHDVERDVESLRSIANLVVETRQPTEDLVNLVMRYLYEHRDPGRLS